jgi:hypothetical protein
MRAHQSQPSVRTIGFRKKADLVPILHTKIVLLGKMWWHGEDGLGGVAEIDPRLHGATCPLAGAIRAAGQAARLRERVGFWFQGTFLRR